MKKAVKIWFITALSLVVLGCVLFAGVMTSLKWDFSKLSTVIYETNTSDINEPFDDISLTTDTADIVFALSKDGICRVECREEKNAKHTVTVENGVLTVKTDDKRTLRDYVGFNFDSPKITVYLPQTEYGTLSVCETTGNIEIPKDFVFDDIDIAVSSGNVSISAAVREESKIKTSTGNITVQDTSAGSLDISVATGTVTVSDVSCTGDVSVKCINGEVQMSDISCKNVVSDGTTGDISLKNVLASEKLSLARSTGYVNFSGCDAGEVYIKTTTGNVTGSLLTEKIFVTATDTGNVEVPETTTGGRCEIRTNTGDIKITV